METIFRFLIKKLGRKALRVFAEEAANAVLGSDHKAQVDVHVPGTSKAIRVTVEYF